MCSTSCDCDDAVKDKLPVSVPLPSSVCKACGEPAHVVLRKRDSYCKTCFLSDCTHKFRATLGKSRLMKHGDNVLVAFSGGPSSAAMVKFILEGLAEDAHKRFVFRPSLLYIDDSVVLGDDGLAEVIGLMEESGLPYYTSAIERVHDKGPLRFDSGPNEKSREAFASAYNAIEALTERESFHRIALRKLITRLARDNGFGKVFTGETGTVLSAVLLSTIALGRGSHLRGESGFLDGRDSDVMILRPMREFTSKEVALFNHYSEVRHRVHRSPGTGCDPRASIFRITETFLSGLQVNFPSTVSTVWRTGDKIVPCTGSTTPCRVCNSPLDCVDAPADSAVSALNLTRRLSRSIAEEESATSQNEQNDLCYACRSLSERVDTRLLLEDAGVLSEED